MVRIRVLLFCMVNNVLLLGKNDQAGGPVLTSFGFIYIMYVYIPL